MGFDCISIKPMEKHINSSNIQTSNSLFKYSKAFRQDKKYKVKQSKQKNERII